MEGGRGRGRGRNKGGRGENSNNGQHEKMNSGVGAGGGQPSFFGFGYQGPPPSWAFPSQFPGQFPRQSWGGGGVQQQWYGPPPQQMQGQTGGQSSDPNNSQGGNLQQSTNQGKIQQKKKQDVSQKQQVSPGLMSYTSVTCYNCGDSGHHKDKCTKPKGCIICKMISHKVEDYPTRRRPHSAAKYVGGAAQGLGFYHLDIPDVNAQHQGCLKNVGIVFVEQGEVTKQELAKEFASIYKTNWPWAINKLDDWTFLVKFPPEIDVEQVAGYPCFGLSKENTMVKVEAWLGDITAEDELQKITSTFGVLLDVDWQHNFQSFYEIVRVKISCKDHRRIPQERIFGIQGKLYNIQIEVEPPQVDAHVVI
nr:uncharacterized protein LOC109768203 [Aegilops tauschii subsp. strangulata]